MGNKKVSGKTHSQSDLNNWANQHNPNNKAFIGGSKNAGQTLGGERTHKQRHNAQRRGRSQPWPDWAPDYIEYDD